MKEDSAHSTAKAVTVLMILTLASKPLGLLREIILASVYGAGTGMDAFTMASGIASAMPILVASYLNYTFLPEYSRTRMLSGEKEAEDFANQVLTLALYIVSGIAIMSYIFARQILGFFAPSFSQEHLAVAIPLLRILLITLPLHVFLYITSAINNARRSFYIMQLTGYGTNIILILAALFFAPRYGIYVLAGSTVAALMIQIIIMVLWTRHLGHGFYLKLNLHNPQIQKTFHLAIPAMAVSAVYQINELVDKILSSGLPEGNISALGYSTRLVGVVSSLIVTPFVTVFITAVSNQAALDDREATKRALWKYAEYIMLVTAPVIVITFFMRMEVVRLIFERNAFLPEDTSRTASILTIYILEFFVSSMTVLFANIFTAYQDMKNIVARGIICVSVNVTASVSLVPFLGIRGIAIGTLISMIVLLLLNSLTLRRRWGSLGAKRTAVEFFKVLVSAALCAVSLWGLGLILPRVTGAAVIDIIRFGASTAVGGCVFFLSAFLLKNRSARDIFYMVMARIKAIIQKPGRPAC